MKPTQTMSARLRLTTKQVNKGYYKGNRTGSMGYFLQNSRYVLETHKLRTYVVPESLKNFKLTPFVTKSFHPTEDPYKKEIIFQGAKKAAPRLMNGEEFLSLWEKQNPRDYIETTEALLFNRNSLRSQDKNKQRVLAGLDEIHKKNREMKGGRPAGSQSQRRPSGPRKN